jgi:hypothetical protein
LKAFLHTLEEASVANEQRDAEGGVSELLLHESWSGTPAHPSSSKFLPVHSSPNLLWLVALY